MEITRINEFQAKPDQAAALRDFLRSVIARIIDAPGCRSCELLVQHDDPTRLAIIEIWDSVEAHQASVSRIPPGLLQQAQTLFAVPARGRSQSPGLCRSGAGSLLPKGPLMERVTGIGGLFFRAQDPSALGRWYRDHLGVTLTPSNYDDRPWQQEAGPTAFAPFPIDTPYFGDSRRVWMVNSRVRALEASD